MRCRAPHRSARCRPSRNSSSDVSSRLSTARVTIVTITLVKSGWAERGSLRDARAADEGRRGEVGGLGLGEDRLDPAIERADDDDVGIGRLELSDERCEVDGVGGEALVVDHLDPGLAEGGREARAMELAERIVREDDRRGLRGELFDDGVGGVGDQALRAGLRVDRREEAVTLRGADDRGGHAGGGDDEGVGSCDGLEGRREHRGDARPEDEAHLVPDELLGDADGLLRVGLVVPLDGLEAVGDAVDLDAALSVDLVDAELGRVPEGTTVAGGRAAGGLVDADLDHLVELDLGAAVAATFGRRRAAGVVASAGRGEQARQDDRGQADLAAMARAPASCHVVPPWDGSRGRALRTNK